MKRSAILTPALILSAMKIAEPSIQRIIELDPTRNVIYVVTLDPVAAAADDYWELWHGAFGEQNHSKWKNTYDRFARLKARVSLEAKMSSHLVQRDAPYLYQKGDFKYGGSDYCNGLITAASGLAWQHDFAVSKLVNGVIHALSIGDFEPELARKDCHFVGHEVKPDLTNAE